MLTQQYVTEIKLTRDKVSSFNEYPFSLPAVRNLDTLQLHPKVTFFVGENGSGKSTLLEATAINWGFNAEGGTKNFNFNTHSSHSTLHEYIRLSKGTKKPRDGFFLRAESFFNVATAIDKIDEDQDENLSSRPPLINNYGGKSLHEQSHGEAFLSLMMNRFSGNSFFILDEPEAALSPQRQLAALVRIHDLIQDNSQFLIATHSPIIMAYPDAYIYDFSNEGIQQINYRDTEHYRVMYNFLSNPDRMIEVLLND
ncbi:AAA family ATPase [Altericista sp. CCNU0014]|uniref:AAA family ATPase n=1 Tax=Altericista sp. CCNU0014 TaxID=3082949 RepID=UPI00384AF063